jgi:conjugal transfer mating pair stabilization protein TraG
MTTADGETTLNYATVNGLSGKVGQNYQEMGMRQGARALSSEENFTRLLSRAEEDGKTSSTAKKFSDTVQESFSETFERGVRDSSAFSMFKNEEKAKLMAAAVQASGGLSIFGNGVRATGEGKYQILGRDGSKIEFNASAEAAEKFNENLSRMRADSLEKAMQTTEGLKYVSTASKQIGAKDAHTYIEQARSVDTMSRGSEVDMMTAYVGDYAVRNHGAVNESTLQQSVMDINRMATGTAEDQDQINRDMQDFLATRYNTMDHNTVLTDINSTRTQVERDQAPIRQEGAAAATEASAAVADNTFIDLRIGLSNPGMDSRKVDGRRTVHDHINDDSGAFDFTSNPLKRVGQEVTRPMDPKPDRPDARNLPGSPGKDFNPGPGFQTPAAFNDPATRPEGISTISGDSAAFGRTNLPTEWDSVKIPGQAAFDNVQDLLNSMNGAEGRERRIKKG